LTAIGTIWRAVLVSDQRGPVVTRKADTREGALALAHVLLDQAANMAWYRGETVSVQIGQSEG
jgi:hypothetical protein